MVVHLDPCEFGFEVKENGLVQQANLKKYPSNFIGACNCVKCAKSSCTYRANEVIHGKMSIHGQIEPFLY